MQRNEVDAALTSIGLGTPELWQKLGQELEGKTQLEQPRVSKKVLVKALRMQTETMRYMVDEFDRLRDKMAEMEREARNTAKHVERVNSKLITVQGQVDDVNTKVYELEVQQNKQAEQLKEIDDVANQVRVNREEIQRVTASVERASDVHNEFVLQTEQKLNVIREDHEVTKQFAMKIEDRLNEEQKELFLDSDHILHNKLTLAMWMEAVEKDNRRKDDALRDCTDKMIKQGRNVQDMMLETRRTLDDNTCAVEDVQRLLLEKADRTRVDEIIESKYEEICNQLDKALASVLGEEDEFKRASQELQQLVTHLSESKADKKDLLEVKEQVLYDSRVRQQVENLRSFIDIKMNRDDVFSALKSKADKDEMLALLKNLSDSMNASIVQAQSPSATPTAPSSQASRPDTSTSIRATVVRSALECCRVSTERSVCPATVSFETPPLRPVGRSPTRIRSKWPQCMAAASYFLLALGPSTKPPCGTDQTASATTTRPALRTCHRGL